MTDTLHIDGPTPGPHPGTVHRHFHDELSELKSTLLAMSAEAQTALATAVDALLQRDRSRAAQVIAGDHKIDTLEIEIEDLVIKLLATQQPMARDLRLLMAAFKIANDLERVGDHAVNIAQSAERLRREPADRARSRKSSRWRAWRAACSPTRSMRSCAPTRRPDGPSAARRSGGRLHDSVFRILLTHMMETPHIISAAIELFLVSRNLERVADLATNVAEDVVFLVEGKSIKHHRGGRRTPGKVS